MGQNSRFLKDFPNEVKGESFHSFPTFVLSRFANFDSNPWYYIDWLIIKPTPTMCYGHKSYNNLNYDVDFNIQNKTMQIDSHVHDYKHHLFMGTLIRKPWKKSLGSWWRRRQDWKVMGVCFLGIVSRTGVRMRRGLGIEIEIFGSWLKSMESESEAWLLFARALSPASKFDIWLVSEGGHTAHQYTTHQSWRFLPGNLFLSPLLATQLLLNNAWKINPLNLPEPPMQPPNIGASRRSNKYLESQWYIKSPSRERFDIPTFLWEKFDISLWHKFHNISDVNLWERIDVFSDILNILTFLWEKFNISLSHNICDMNLEERFDVCGIK